VAIDGVQVGGLGCIVADRKESEAIAQLRASSGRSAREVWPEARAILAAAGQHTVPMFYAALESMAQLSIEDALAAPDAIVRALACLDSRIGKRRLRRMVAVKVATALEAKCLALRLSVEGIPVEAATDASSPTRGIPTR